jgi:arylsulfatase A-like enzyme/Flp pilus assembly protein TadD
VAAATGLLGCTRPKVEELRIPADTPIILISIDTLRSDRLPAYGYDAVATPNIDALAQEAIRFEHAYSPYPLTLPAHASLFTGLLPTDHGVRDNGGYRLAAEALPHLPRALKDLGFTTGAAISSYVLRETTGLAVGFDFYDSQVQFRSGAILGDVQRSGVETLNAAGAWLESVANQPFFFFFHIYEPHTPHAPPEPFASAYASPYDGEVAAADAVVGLLLRELRQLEVYDRALVILLSDHGEGLDDHGDYEHGLLLYREVLQIPLLLKLPGGERGGTRVSRPVELIDIFPTILGLLDQEVPAELLGYSLLAGEPTEEETDPIYAETYFPSLHFGWSDLQSAIEFPYHYIEGPDPELYNLEQDPGELHNLLNEERRVVGSLRQWLESRETAFVPPSEVDRETREKLAALGYLGGGAGDRSGPLPDPKSQLHVLEGLKQAVEDFSQGSYEKATAGFREVLAAQPQLIDAWEHLGQSLMALGRFEDALEAYERGFEASNRAPHFATAMAGALMQLGRLDEARQHAELASHAHELSHDLLAQIAIRQGDLEAAEAYVERAVATRGTRLGPLLTKAELLFMRNRLDEVIDLTVEVDQLATGADVEQLRGLYYLQGSAHVRLGQANKAEASFRREIELFPDELAAYTRLAVIYKITDRTDDALRTIERLVQTNPLPAAYAEGTRALRTIGQDQRASRLLKDGLTRWPADRELLQLASPSRPG